ncbi:MAG: DUF2924 domain-containing protein [Pirellulales bacterium]
MTTSTQMQLAELADMTTGVLVRKYGELFGEPTRSRNRVHLVRKIAWRIQELAEGGLSERARRRAEELAKDADVRVTPPRARSQAPTGPSLYMPTSSDRRIPPPGSVLAKLYKGRTVRVLVTEDGFEHDGERYRSLTAVAKAVSGSHCSGIRFFGLGGKK